MFSFLMALHFMIYTRRKYYKFGSEDSYLDRKEREVKEKATFQELDVRTGYREYERHILIYLCNIIHGNRNSYPGIRDLK